MKIKFQSFDGKISDCEIEAAKMSITVKNMLESTEVDNKPIPLPNKSLTDDVVKKIIEYVEYHFDDPISDDEFDDDKDKRNEELSQWDKNFIDVSDRGFFFDILDGANYLDIKGLIDVCAKHIINKIKGKSCKEVRQILNITNDFTPEEEEAIHKENEWIHQNENDRT